MYYIKTYRYEHYENYGKWNFIFFVVDWASAHNYIKNKRSSYLQNEFDHFGLVEINVCCNMKKIKT